MRVGSYTFIKVTQVVGDNPERFLYYAERTLPKGDYYVYVLYTRKRRVSMNTSILLLVVALLSDLVLLGIFVREYIKSKERTSLVLILCLIFVFLMCIYFLLDKLGVVIVF
jgi:hypothetical protein